MKKVIIIAFVLFYILFFTSIVQAKSGCCSSHNGVNCSAGPQDNGKVVCNDGWTGSSCDYSGMVMCEGTKNITDSVPPTPTNTPYIPPPTNTPIPTRTLTPSLIPTNPPSPVSIEKTKEITPPIQVAGSKKGSGLDILVGLGVLGGIFYGGKKLVDKARNRIKKD